MLTHLRAPSFLFFAYKLFSFWIWLKYCLLDLKQSINDFAHIIVSSSIDVSTLLFNINIPRYRAGDTGTLFFLSFPFFVFIYFIFLFNSDFSWLDSTTRYLNKAWSSRYLKIYGILTLLVHHDWIQVFMESVLFIYVFSLVLVCPCQLFVHLWYRVSDVLDLFLVSKRFVFWPHITHVIVLTFKEIKHLSDYRTVGL
jgi:hypothetical protein